MSDQKPVAATNGDQYVPYDQRTGEESVVYFTRDLSEEGLKKVYNRIKEHISGKTGVKLHTGEKNGPNIIPRPWVKELLAYELPDANIVETNTYYEGDRYTTEQHRETLKVNGWTFCPVDIMDEDGTAMLPVKDGKWFTEMSVGKNLLNYDSLLVLTHFKGHVMGGFGGSNKNIGIGCADGSPCVAIGEGTVTATGTGAFSGNYVQIRFDYDGYTWTVNYMHLSQINCSSGDHVNVGDVIGLSGHTGRVTGPHLHIEILCNGAYKNPAGLISGHGKKK